jgi:RimJ/RimL family protein N-acetyltransferase
MLSDDVIYLRKLEATDLDRTWLWVNDPEIAEKIGTPIPVSKSEQLRWFERTDQANDKIVFALCLKDGDIHIGNLSLDNIEPRHRTARLSIFIADRSHRRQSIGSRAIRLLVDYAFDHLNLNRVWCKTTAADVAVVRFYEKLGFAIEGVMRAHEIIEGQYVDKTILALLRSDYGQR